jgi:hypothetical protein
MGKLLFPLTLLLLCLLQYGLASNGKRVMVWLCLEFCEETKEQIQQELLQLKSHSDIVHAVSFEKYTLGPNSTLVDNHLTVVSPFINKIGLEAWPLLSSFPHPVEFIDWMREVFINPKPFIEQCISEAKKYNYIGYNLDWEPTDDVTSEDGVNYANFIDVFARELHQADLKLTVDVATWSPIWNYTAIAATGVDMGISMGTYTSTDSSFTKQLNNIVTAFGPNRAGVGLETVNASTGAAIPMNEVQWRFDQINASGAKEIDIWSSPVPSAWWPLLKQFTQN